MLKASIAFLAAASFCSGLVLECNFRMTSWTVIGSRYTCDGTIAASDFADLSIENVNGQHLTGRDNADVNVVNILNQQGINRVASNFESFFPNLEGLRWFNGSLKWIDANDLRPFPNLELVSFRGNQLVSLESRLLQFNPKLRYISFRDNLLENVGHNFFTGLTSLEQAAFNNNPCINIFASNPLALEALNLQLPISCPPLPETEIPEQCPDGCVNKIDSLRVQVQQQNDRIAALEQVIQSLKNQMDKTSLSEL